MDRRQFIKNSATGLSAAWAGASALGSAAQEPAEFLSLDDTARLAALPDDAIVTPPPSDWLITPTAFKTSVFRTSHADEITMTNGLIRRTWRLRPNAATVGFDNLMTGAAILRAVKPEAYVKLDWQAETAVGGLLGQTDGAYLTPEGLDTDDR